MEINFNKDKKSWIVIAIFLAEFVRMFLKEIILYPLPLVLALGLTFRIDVIRKASILALFFYCSVIVFGFYSILASSHELILDDLNPYLRGLAFVLIETGLLLLAWLLKNPYQSKPENDSSPKS